MNRRERRSKRVKLDDTGKPFDVRWSGRATPIFVEIAEALGITTEHIMGAHERGELVVALYTKGLDDPTVEQIWAAQLQRGVDGVLFAVTNRSTGKTFDQWWKENVGE